MASRHAFAVSHDLRVLSRARHRADAALSDFLADTHAQRAIVVSAPAGAGKTGFVVKAVRKARRPALRLRVAVCTPTNEQAFGLVRRLAMSDPKETVTFVPASDVTLPVLIARLPNVRQSRAANANAATTIVGTLAKLGDAFSRGDLGPVDALLIDESYQADSSWYYGVGNLASLHLLVGDLGQLNPFSPIVDAYHWRGLPEDPLQAAVGLLLRNHPATPVYKLPVSRRLDPRGIKVAQLFYRDLQFDAAVLPDVRRLQLLPAVAVHRQDREIDHLLDSASRDGWAHFELPDAAVLTADPGIIEFIGALVNRLALRRPRVRCEWQTTWQELPAQRVAIGVSHNDQKDLLRAHLDSMGYPDVVVETANKLQGLEFNVVIAWHPLAGLPEPDGFHLDPGRLCVLLTRHRHACIVIGRAGDRKLLRAIPPTTPAYLGWDPDPVFDGWELHEAIFSALDPHRIIA